MALPHNTNRATYEDRHKSLERTLMATSRTGDIKSKIMGTTQMGTTTTSRLVMRGRSGMAMGMRTHGPNPICDP